MAVEESDFFVLFVFNSKLNTWVYGVETGEVIVDYFSALMGADAEFRKDVVDVLLYEVRDGVASLVGDFFGFLKCVGHPYVRYRDHE